MENKELLDHGLEMLNDIDVEGAEIVMVDKTNYKDGSVCYSVNVTMPAKDKENE